MAEFSKTFQCEVNSETPDLDAAFSAGACAAYDDCGHDIPPWWCGKDAEMAAWKRGLASGYEDTERLTQQRERGPRQECKHA